MNTAQPGGSFVGRFPPKIRNRIYELVLLEHPYRVCGQPNESFTDTSIVNRCQLYGVIADLEDPARASCPEPIANLGILSSCKTINEEATPILYGRGLFRIYLGDDYGMPVSDWQWKVVAEGPRCIRNVEIILDFAIFNETILHSEDDPGFFCGPLSDIFDPFKRVGAIRNSLTIKLSALYHDMDMDYLNELVPLVNAGIKDIVGFQTVIINVSSTAPPDLLIEAKLATLPETDEVDDILGLIGDVGGYDAIPPPLLVVVLEMIGDDQAPTDWHSTNRTTQELQEVLERYLGPCKSYEDPQARNVFYSHCLEFYPAFFELDWTENLPPNPASRQ